MLVPEFGDREVDSPAHAIDTAERAMLRQAVPGVVRQPLCKCVSPDGIEALLPDLDGSDLDERRVGLFPGPARILNRLPGWIELPLDHEVETGIFCDKMRCHRLAQVVDPTRRPGVFMR